MTFDTITIIVMLLCLYVLPSIIAISRHHHNTAPIVIINIVFGWSFVGWVITLAWALSYVRKES